MESPSFRVYAIFFSIWLFVFGGYLETFGGEWLSFYKNPLSHCYFDPQNIVYTLKNIVKGWIETFDKENFIIAMAGRFGHRKTFSEPENLKMILLIFIGIWGIAIFFVLGLILYRIIIEPLIKERRSRKGRR
jgi:hypothetical protein